jgi:two-component system phosphate regulon sensor histidine kinase PhoR
VLLAGGVWWSALAALALVFAVTYSVCDLVLRKFVIFKLKPIYQIVHSKNIKTKQLEHELAHQEEMLDAIEGDINAWEERNRKEIRRLKDTEKYRKEYIGNVSHEIKTPVFNVQGYISTLLDGGLEDPAINRQYLERAEKSIDRLINIVHDLDEISKLESGILKLNLERFDLVELVRDVVETLEIDAERKNITIRAGHKTTDGYPNAPIYVMADKHYVSQIVVNLVINSINYGNEGGTTTISFVDMFDKVMMEVSDTGVGIARDDIPRVFERFYRTDKSRSREQGGTGLGLAIVKHIIEAHGETITLRSELGRGSTFSFTLTKA